MPGLKMKKGPKGPFNGRSGGGQSGEYTITGLGTLDKALLGDESSALRGDNQAPCSPVSGTIGDW